MPICSQKFWNYTYPKMKVDPRKAVLVSANGRAYPALSLLDLQEYYYPYIIGYAGNAYNRFEERTDILRKTLYVGDVIFSGQEVEGYLVFPALDPDVGEITIKLEDVILRFNVFDEPSETTDIHFFFRRDLGRFYVNKGKVVLQGAEGEETSR